MERAKIKREMEKERTEFKKIYTHIYPNYLTMKNIRSSVKTIRKSQRFCLVPVDSPVFDMVNTIRSGNEKKRIMRNSHGEARMIVKEVARAFVNLQIIIDGELS